MIFFYDFMTWSIIPMFFSLKIKIICTGSVKCRGQVPLFVG